MLTLRAHLARPLAMPGGTKLPAHHPHSPYPQPPQDPSSPSSPSQGPVYGVSPWPWLRCSVRRSGRAYRIRFGRWVSVMLLLLVVRLVVYVLMRQGNQRRSFLILPSARAVPPRTSVQAMPGRSVPPCSHSSPQQGSPHSSSVLPLRVSSTRSSPSSASTVPIPRTG